MTVLSPTTVVNVMELPVDEPQTQNEASSSQGSSGGCMQNFFASLLSKHEIKSPKNVEIVMDNASLYLDRATRMLASESFLGKVTSPSGGANVNCRWSSDISVAVRKQTISNGHASGNATWDYSCSGSSPETRPATYPKRHSVTGALGSTTGSWSLPRPPPPLMIRSSSISSASPTPPPKPPIRKLSANVDEFDKSIDEYRTSRKETSPKPSSNNNNTSLRSALGSMMPSVESIQGSKVSSNSHCRNSSCSQNTEKSTTTTATVESSCSYSGTEFHMQSLHNKDCGLIHEQRQATLTGVGALEEDVRIGDSSCMCSPALKSPGARIPETIRNFALASPQHIL